MILGSDFRNCIILAWSDAAPPGGRERPFRRCQVVLEASAGPRHHGLHGERMLT